MNSVNRVIINTAASYAALLIKMLIGLFSVRFVLQALGETNYGIYIAVAGVIGMLDILNAGMINTTLRFMSHSFGAYDKQKALTTFNTAIFIHIAIGMVSIFILEGGGWLMFNYILNVPEGRMMDAQIIYQFMVATSFVSIVLSPYSAVVNSHEHIWVLSLIDVMYSVCILSLSLVLLHSSGNRLIQYGLGLFSIQTALTVVRVAYCRHKFEESRKIKRAYVSRDSVKAMLSYTGWNLLSNVSSVGALQMKSLMINLFFGVRFNASDGVASQVDSAISNVSNSMTRAINPQIMKSEGGGNRERMIYVVEVGSKYSSFLYALICIPIILEAPYLLNLWLDKVPEFAVLFCRLGLMISLLEKFSFQITQAINAVGDIKWFQIINSIIIWLYLPFAYMAYRNGYPPETIFYVIFCMRLLVFAERLYFGRKVAGINPWHFIKSTMLNILLAISPAIVGALLIFVSIDESFMRFLLVLLIYCIVFTIIFWFVGTEKSEKDIWKGIAMGIQQKVKSVI